MGADKVLVIISLSIGPQTHLFKRMRLHHHMTVEKHVRAPSPRSLPNVFVCGAAKRALVASHLLVLLLGGREADGETSRDRVKYFCESFKWVRVIPSPYCTGETKR